jgi:hypothetical protein
MRGWIAALLILGLAVPGAAAAGSWRIVEPAWSAADEAGFSRFVAAIGTSNCSSAQSCLRDEANPFRASDKHFLDVDADCAKWPYLLRAYYAWKNGLPFSFVDGVFGAGGDLRYSKQSNHPAGRHGYVDRGDGIDGPRAVREVIDTVSSATYRMDATQEKGVPADFYAPALTPDSIRPGTVIYDINGHVGIVYRVDADGRIYYMDAHPDFTITRSVYGAQFGQSPARLGGGLKNWRPLKLVGAHADGQGHWIGGHIVAAANREIADFSLVQYLGTEPNANADVKAARFVWHGEAMGFYAYVRTAVSGGKMDYNPLYELKSTVKTLCNDLHDRAQYVDLAVSEGLPTRDHPAALPDNIYGTDDGEWENYATPSRDARIKAGFVQFYRDMAAMIAMWVKRDPHLVYDGLDLQADLRRTYRAASDSCSLVYLDSARRPVRIGFDDMTARLFLMSFDPFHCIELRWGASGSERASCPDGKRKLRWYLSEQRLRNQPERTYDIAMGFDLDALERHVRGSGIDVSPPIDVLKLIESMPPRVPLEAMAPIGR